MSVTKLVGMIPTYDLFLIFLGVQVVIRIGQLLAWLMYRVVA